MGHQNNIATHQNGNHSIDNSLLNDFNGEMSPNEIGQGAPLSFCPQSTFSSLEAGSSQCTFLSTAAAAAAIFRNVNYMNRCQI